MEIERVLALLVTLQGMNILKGGEGGGSQLVNSSWEGVFINIQSQMRSLTLKPRKGLRLEA